MEFNHFSVLLNECVDSLRIKPDGIYVDGTTGGAGHSKLIAQKLNENGKLFCFDKDPDAMNTAKERLKDFNCVTFILDDFMSMSENLLKHNVTKVDGILLDLGVSSYQLDTGERGFSYNKDAFLDMRMSKMGQSAYDVVNTYSEQELNKILRDYGEERFSKLIARNIVKNRSINNISTTLELVDIIKASLPSKVKRKDKNPARQTFQAIRIEVNKELEALETALDDGFNLLGTDGIFSIITFHSLEDRIVKQRFINFSTGCTCPSDFPICVCNKKPRGKILNKKPILAKEQELNENKRSRSAKLRVIKKL